MPGRDGTGPLGAGAMTGRGLGPCALGYAAQYGAGLGLGLRRGFGCGRGFGRFYTADQVSPKTKKELLTEQKKLLESRLEFVSRQLENL